MEGSFIMQEFTHENGLSQKEAEKRLEEYGKNRLESKKKQNAIKIFFSQFKDVMVLILLGATLISVFMGELLDAVTIVLIVLLDAILGFIQEYRTEKTMEALEKLTSPTAKVLRDGKRTELDASLIVPGDIVFIESGDRVPCDGIVVEENGLWCDEAILTGESETVRKNIYDNQNVSMGTSVTRGNAVIRCDKTGMQTKMGQMSKLIDEAGNDETPLQKKLASLGRVLCIICIAVCFIVAIAGIVRGEPVFDMLMTGITIAIAAIPEGLPATVTIALALAVRRMLKRNALVHKLHSVETLGCTTVICTDKTGTLTENKMSVTRIWSDKCDYTLTGSGRKREGGLMLNGKPCTASSKVKELLTCASLCNNAEATLNNGEYTTNGDPTEAALIIAAEKCGILHSLLKDKYKRINEVPFESETKRMSVTVSSESGKRVYIKGAPDIVIKECSHILTDSGSVPINAEYLAELKQAVEKYAKSALRVMAFAYSEPNKNEVVLLGLVGMLDAPRPEAKASCDELRRAGIKTVMITGDHKLTAEAIAKEVGILRFGSISLSKDELDALSDTELDRVIERVSVFSRVDPKDKLRIVSSLKRKGHIVAMTGDGVNDAPAIKEANIGVAMGKQGTDACKQAADLILLDDNISTLCEAVKQGRTIYSNIRKFVRYLISCNIGEVMVMFLSIISGLPVILLPTQILLVNLVTDGLPAVALGLEKTEKAVLDMKPKQFSGSFFSGGLLSKIIIRGILIGICTLGCFVYSLYIGTSLETARTCALVTLIASQLIHVFECRSESISIFRMNPFKNAALIASVLISAAATLACVYVPALSVVMQTTQISLYQMGCSLIFAAAVPVISGIIMLVFKKKN